MRKRMGAWLMSAVLTVGACGFSGCTMGLESGAQTEKEVVVCMPDGAPAMGFASLMRADSEEDGVTYKVVSPSVIASKVSAKNQDENADICALPVTAASKLLGDGTRYKMLGVLTGGNLYLLSKDDGTVENFAVNGVLDLSHLVGKTVGVMKINEVPGLTFKCVLDGYGLPWQEVKNDGETAADKVNLKAIVDAAAIDPLAQDIACYVVAEPAASVQIQKNAFTRVASLENLYKQSVDGEGAGYDGYPQAVLVAKTSLIEARTAWVEDFIADVAQSALAVHSLSGEEIVSAVIGHLEDSAYTSTLKANVLTADTVEKCGVRFAESAVCKEAVQVYLTRLTAVDSAAAKKVADGFFYVNS